MVRFVLIPECSLGSACGHLDHSNAALDRAIGQLCLGFQFRFVLMQVRTFISAENSTGPCPRAPHTRISAHDALTRPGMILAD
eukprot:832392-Rhodomonas_salina.2